jgi:hypothetical protein
MEGLGIRIVVERLGIEVVIEGLGIRAGCFFFNSAHTSSSLSGHEEYRTQNATSAFHLKPGLSITTWVSRIQRQLYIYFWYVCVLVCCRAKRWTPHVGFEKQSCPEELSSGGSTWVRQRAMLPLMVHPCLGNLERSTWSTTGGGGSRPRFQRWTKAAMSAQQQRRVRF